MGEYNSEIISGEKLNMQDERGNDAGMFQYVIISNKALKLGLCEINQ